MAARDVAIAGGRLSDAVNLAVAIDHVLAAHGPVTERASHLSKALQELGDNPLAGPLWFREGQRLVATDRA